VTRKSSSLPAARQPLQARAVETRHHILTTAMTMLTCEGYSAITSRALADRAKVSVGSIYDHFGSIDAIWIALIETRGHATLAILDTVFSDDAMSRPFDELFREYDARMREARLWSQGWYDLMRITDLSDKVQATLSYFLSQHASRYVNICRAYGATMGDAELQMISDYMVQIDASNFALQRNASSAERAFYGDLTHKILLTLGQISGANIF
jgi:AcrR family transcriptional regulator